MKLTKVILIAALAFTFYDLTAQPQIETKPPRQPDTVQTFYLSNISQVTDGTEIVTAIRNIVTPNTKVYFVPSQNAIIMNATADQLLIAQKILNDLDRPKRTYRLTYTMTETDGGKRLGIQHFTMIVVSGQRTVLTQGSRVPIITGVYKTESAAAQSQVTYIDIGLRLDATLDESVNGVRLRTKAEQSSVAPETSGVGAQDPVVRQTVLEGTSILTPGKPLVVGSLDIPGSTRHQDVEIVMEVVR